MADAVPNAHSILYYIFLEDEKANPMSAEATERIRRVLQQEVRKMGKQKPDTKKIPSTPP